MQDILLDAYILIQTSFHSIFLPTLPVYKVTVHQAVLGVDLPKS